MDILLIGFTVLFTVIALYVLVRKQKKTTEQLRNQLSAESDKREHAELLAQGLQRSLDQQVDVHLSEFQFAQELKARITRSSMMLLGESHPGSFIIDRPKDGIGGDLFWSGSAENKLYLACGDMTARGVMGALLAQMAKDLLHEVIITHHDPRPSIILEQLERRAVASRDRMMALHGVELDIAMCELDLHDNRLRISASRHDVLLMRNGILERVKGHRSPQGSGQGERLRELFDARLQKGDRIFLFSDGITNQFGGLHGKKLKCTGLMKTLENTARLSMEETRMVLQNQLRSWMIGSDQVDDMLFVGLEIPH